MQKKMEECGAGELLVTSMDRDGTQVGYDIELMSNISSKVNIPVIASGGVSSIDDIKKARTMENIEGIIVGKAIYDGDIKLEELVKEDA